MSSDLSSAPRSTLSTRSRSTGLFRNPTAPAACTMSCDDCCTSADTTTTRAAGSSSRSFASTSRPYIPFMTRSRMTTSGLSTEVSLERGHAILGFDDLEARGLRASRACSAAPVPNRRRAAAYVSHMLQNRFGHPVEPHGADRSGRPRRSRAAFHRRRTSLPTSVTIVPPCGLNPGGALRARPSPMPVITMPSTRPRYASAAD